MPIEFRCHQCQKLLRTKDDTAGKQAKCPQCGTVLTVPSSTAAAPPSQPIHTGPPVVDTGNPYQAPAPTSRKSRSTAQAPASGELTATKVDMGDLTSRAWSIYKSKFGLSLTAVLVVLLVSVLLMSVIGGVLYVADLSGSAPALLVAALVYTVPVLWISVGQFNFFLKIARGEDATINDLFGAGARTIPTLLVMLAVVAVVELGFALCFVPGIILGAMFSLALFFSLDRGAGFGEAFKLSKEYTQGNKMTLSLMFLVVWLLGSLLNIVTCGIGGIFFMPYMFILLSLTYLACTGQRTAE